MMEGTDEESVDGYESDDSDDGYGKPKECCFFVAPTVAGKCDPQKPTNANQASDCFAHSFCPPRCSAIAVSQVTVRLCKMRAQRER